MKFYDLKETSKIKDKQTMKLNLIFSIVLLALTYNNKVVAQIYQGIVCDDLTHKPLQYAIISLFGTTNNVLVNTITGEEGKFSLNENKNGKTIRVSLLGYETKTMPIENRFSPNDTIFLNVSGLNEVTVVGKREIHDIDKDTYFVTDSMRQGMTFAAQMIGQLPGVRYDWFGNNLSVYGSKNILLLVDGFEKDASYIKNINPKRIEQIELIHTPNGRYVSDNYAAIINLKLKQNYVGWDLYIEDINRFDLNRLDREGWMRLFSPRPSFTYTHNKLSINMNYYSAYQKYPFTDNTEQNFNGLVDYVYQPVENEKLHSHTEQDVSFGADYQITPNHIVSFQNKYWYNNFMTPNHYTLLTTINGQTRRDTHSSYTEAPNHDYTGTLFYRGKFNDKWELYSDLCYNYYVYSLQQNVVRDNYTLNNHYRDHKNYIRFNTDATYTRNAITLKFGYSTTWKEYISHNQITNTEVSRSDNYRQRIFAYFIYKISPQWNASTGGAVEWIYDKNQLDAKHYTAFMPEARLMYQPNKSVNLTLQYNTSTSYPNLSQVANTHYNTDSMTVYEGNPLLRQGLFHNIIFRARLWKCLTIYPSVSYGKDAASTFYSWQGTYLLSTHVNTSTRTYTLGANFDKSFGNLNIQIGTSFRRNEVRYADIINACNIWSCYASLMYFDTRNGYGALLNYERSIGTNVELQGFSEDISNSWRCALIKNLYKNRITLSLEYILPLKWLVKEIQRNNIHTDFYRSVSSLNNFNVNKNILTFNIRVRLDYGKKTKAQENVGITDYEIRK